MTLTKAVHLRLDSTSTTKRFTWFTGWMPAIGMDDATAALAQTRFSPHPVDSPMRIIARLLFAGTAMFTVLTVCALVSRLPAAYATNEVYSGWSYHLQRVERDGVEVSAEDADAATWVDGGSGIVSGSTSGVVFVNRREQIYATTPK